MNSFIRCKNCNNEVPVGNYCDQCGSILEGMSIIKDPVPSITLKQVKGGNAILKLKPDTIIGRTHGEYIDQLKNYTYISGKHAIISYTEREGWKVTDIGSTNGTYVNDDRLDKGVAHIFKKGDIIDFGTMIFEVI